MKKILGAIKNFGGKVWTGVKRVAKWPLSKTTKKIIFLVVIILLTLFFIFGMVGLAAYKNDSNSKVVSLITRIIPFPAAIVNGNLISLYDYKFEYAAWAKASASQQGAKVDPATVRSDVMNKMIYDVALRQLARKFKVTATTDDVNKALDEIAQTDFGGKDKLTTQVQTMFGWTVDQFKDRLVYPYVLSNKLNAVFASDEKLNQAAKDKAQKVLERLKGGEDFGAVAREVSEDTQSAKNSGDLGWFGKGATVKEFEEAAYALKVGEMSGLVKSAYGYHILKLVERGLPPDKDGKPSKEKVTADNEQVHVSHILIRTQSFSEYLQDYITKAKVWKFIK